MQNQSNKVCIFLDRDGIINVNKEYVYKIEDFEFCDGVFDFVKILNMLNFYDIFVVTNQSGVEKGYYTENDIKILHEYMLEKFKQERAAIKEIVYCPHLNCNWRKPNPGMLEYLIKKHSLENHKKFMIGDRITDMEVGKKVGATTIQINNEEKYDVSDYKVSNIRKAIGPISDSYFSLIYN